MKEKGIPSKKCHSCGKLLPLNAYGIYKRMKNGLHSDCKECCRKRHKEYRKENRERMLNREREWVKNNKHKDDNSKYKSRYGITKDDKIKMIKSQENKCYICKKELISFRHSFIDHNHATGLIRKILCPACNVSMSIVDKGDEFVISLLNYKLEHEENTSMISKKDYLMGRDEEFPISSEMEKNLAILLEKLSELEKLYGKPLKVSSGYRPGHYNEKAGGAKNSTHCTCQGCDLVDVDGKLKNWIINSGILVKLDLYLEIPAKTPTWAHVQTRRTASGSRIFKP